MNKDNDDDDDDVEDMFRDHGPSHGAKAVRSGQYAENALESKFLTFKVRTFDDHPSFHQQQFWPRTGRALLRQHPIKTGNKIDYLYRDYDRNIPVAIEAKNQMGEGTTDQKLAYAVDILLESGYPFYWLVLHGGGFNKDVVSRIYKKIENCNGNKHQPQGALIHTSECFPQGRLIQDVESILQRAIEALVDRGKAI